MYLILEKVLAMKGKIITLSAITLYNYESDDCYHKVVMAVQRKFIIGLGIRRLPFELGL